MFIHFHPMFGITLAPANPCPCGIVPFMLLTSHWATLGSAILSLGKQNTQMAIDPNPGTPVSAKTIGKWMSIPQHMIFKCI